MFDLDTLKEKIKNRILEKLDEMESNEIPPITPPRWVELEMLTKVKEEEKGLNNELVNEAYEKAIIELENIGVKFQRNKTYDVFSR